MAHKINFFQKNIFTPILLSILILNNCSESTLEPESSNSCEGIYIFVSGENEGIFYSDFDSINFTKIAEKSNYESMWLASDFPLLIAASKKQISFINTHTNKKIDDIIVPNTVNPEPNIWYGPVLILKNKQSKDRCILVNRSVYMINLQTKRIESVIWNVEQFDSLTYIHDVAQTEDGQYLLLQLTYRGCWPIGPNLEQCGWKQRLIKLDISNGNTQIIHEYPPENYTGAHYVFSTDKSILSYSPNIDQILIFDFSSATLLDSFYVSETEFFGDEYPYDEGIIIQSNDNGNFFRIIPDEKKIEPIIQLNLGTLGLGHLIYQSLKGGDLYACVVDPSGKKHSIVNLTTRNIVLEFENNFTYLIIYKE